MIYKCLIVDDDEMARANLEHFIQQTDFLELVAVSTDGVEAMKILKESDIDVVFLDVEMPNMTGIDLLEAHNDLPYVILVTSKPEYAVDAFEHNVLDYLLKPLKYARFLKAVNRIKEDEEKIQTYSKDEVFVKTDLKFVKIRFSRIKFVEAMADYVVIHIDNTKHIVHSTMKNMVEKFPSDKFVRVHRSYIVRIDKIATIEYPNLTLENIDKVIPIGGSYRDDLTKRIRTV